ncbi:MAG: class I SAM-dependent methyltransferase, partial [Chitinophagaceae bacterium]
VLKKMGKLDFVFIDGNHAYAPTLRYFNAMLPFVHSGTVMILDDIHWSAEMEKAWQAISNHSAVTLSIDLFFVGILFFREEQLHKQHFRIHF